MAEEQPDIDIPDGRLAQLKHSVGNLWDEFGQTENISLAVVINLSMIGLGLLVFALTTGWVSVAGAVWAVFNAYPLIQWVFGL